MDLIIISALLVCGKDTIIEMGCQHHDGIDMD